MAKDASRIELLQGTLDLLILRTLIFGPSHGHAIARHIKAVSDDVLQVETGSLYPALHRLERQKWVTSEWQTSENNQRVKVYRLTSTGKKQLLVERSRWEQFAAAVAGVLDPAEGEG